MIICCTTVGWHDFQRGATGRLVAVIDDRPVADFEKSYTFLRADLEPPLAERETLSGGSIDGPVKALSSQDVARQWDQAPGAERRSVLVDAVGTDHVRLLPPLPGTRIHVFNPDRVVLVPAAAPLVPRTTA